MSPRGGKRANQTGRPLRADVPSSASIRVPMTPTEHTLILSALTPPETPAGFLRAAGIARAKQRTRRTKRKVK